MYLAAQPRLCLHSSWMNTKLVSGRDDWPKTWSCITRFTHLLWFSPSRPAEESYHQGLIQWIYGISKSSSCSPFPLRKHPCFHILSMLLADLADQEGFTSSSAIIQNYLLLWIYQSHILLMTSRSTLIESVCCDDQCP